MNRADCRKIFRGTIATLPTPFDGGKRLDLPRMSDLTSWWVEHGLGSDVAPLKVAAVMGEGPMLGDDEWPALLRTVVNAAGSDASVICALKPKDTIHTIEDAKKSARSRCCRPTNRPSYVPLTHPRRLCKILLGHFERYRYWNHDL